MTRDDILRELRTPLPEDLTPSDRSLDAAIAELLGHSISWASTRYTQTLVPAITWKVPHPYAGTTEPCPMFTASLDAAFGLFSGTSGAETALASLAARSAQFLEEGRRDLSRLPRAILVDLVETVSG